MLNAASRAGAIEALSKEIFSEDPEVHEACKEWFEFKDRLNNQDEGLLDWLRVLAERAHAKAEASVNADDRFNDHNE